MKKRRAGTLLTPGAFFGPGWIGAGSATTRAVRTHHERWDGSGYPDGLSGEDIPLLGRVLAVVDVFEAVTSQRPYRGPMPRSEARRLIRDGMGSHFDPRVAAEFLRLEAAGAIVTEVEPDRPHGAMDLVPMDTGEYPTAHGVRHRVAG